APKEAARASERTPLRAMLAALRSLRQKKPRVPTAEESAAAALRRRQALAIVERHANYSALSGFIPVPLVNAGAITVVLVRMVRQLCRHYDVPFQSNRAYALVLGSMGGVMPTGLATFATSTIYFVPGPNFIGLAVSSVTASAYARDIGRVLIDHFEAGETLEPDHLPDRRPWLWQELWGPRIARRERAWARAVYGP